MTTKPSGTVATEFDTAIALESLGEGVYTGSLGEGWRIGGGINGGVILALMGHAIRLELEPSAAGPAVHPDPLAISAYYLTPGVPGPANVGVRIHRRGRAVSVASAVLTQQVDGEEVDRVRVLATYGDLAAVDPDPRLNARPPDLPPVEECVATADAPPSFLQHSSLLDRLDLRLDPATMGWAVGKPSGNGVIRGWLRLADLRDPDPLTLLLAVDALPPVAFDLGLPGWTPTLELTAHVRGRPAPGWLRVSLVSRTLSGGLMEEDAEVWDSSGRLVALSRQLARASSPRR